MQIAIFVDAGYLYAQGSGLIAGQKQERTAINLSVADVLKKLTEKAKEVAPGVRLLRAYWYDGLPRRGYPTDDHIAVAQAPDTKLRLGTINSEGKQKGVDSLIVTDLIDLARNQAISDALILSGDEDIRIGVQIAQTFGVRIHLLGIKPARGSQSLELMQEADTCHEWTQEVIDNFMTVLDVRKNYTRPEQTQETVRRPTTISNTRSISERNPDALDSNDFEALIVEESGKFIKQYDASQLKDFVEFLSRAQNQIPPEIDRPMLAILRNRLGRDLDYEQRARYREIFADQLHAAVAS